LPQEKARPLPTQDLGRQKLAQDQARQKLDQDQAGQKSEPENGSAGAPPATIYPVTSTSGLAGLVCVSVTAESAASYGLDSPKGMAVTGVLAGGAAERAGIHDRDVILKIKGLEVRDLSMLNKIGADHSETVPVDVFRNGNHRVVQLVVGR
jgi:C-terminal processing protease CtpA/Prc